MYTITSKVLAGVGVVAVVGSVLATGAKTVQLQKELDQVNSKIVVPTSTPLVIKATATPTATPSATVAPVKGIYKVIPVTRAVN